MTILSGEMRERGAGSPRGWQEVVLTHSVFGNLILHRKAMQVFYNFQGCTSSIERNWPALVTPPGLSFYNCIMGEIFPELLSRLGPKSPLDMQKHSFQPPTVSQ